MTLSGRLMDKVRRRKGNLPPFFLPRPPEVTALA